MKRTLVFLTCLILWLTTLPEILPAASREEGEAPAEPLNNADRKVSSDASDTTEKPSGSIGAAPIPIIFYTPESSLAIGGSVILTFRDSENLETRRPDNLQLIAVYTMKNQTYLSMVPTIFFNDEKGKFRAIASYADWPSSFFGIGNKADLTPQEIDDLEETYLSESWMIQPWLTHKIFSDFAVGLTYDLKQNSISQFDPESGIDPHSLEGFAGGLRSGAGPVISWDTRNHLFYPTSGSWNKIWSWHYRDFLGSDFNYDYYAFDLRGYRTIVTGHVLAYQAIGVATNGEVPFNELPTPLIRGLYQDVFIDDNMLTLQVEYRFPIKNRWSGAAFLACGDVFHNGEDYDITNVKYGGGGGIRYAVSSKEKINFRLDVGVSPYGIFPYIMFQEAF